MFQSSRFFALGGYSTKSSPRNAIRFFDWICKLKSHPRADPPLARWEPARGHETRTHLKREGRNLLRPHSSIGASRAERSQQAATLPYGEPPSWRLTGTTGVSPVAAARGSPPVRKDRGQKTKDKGWLSRGPLPFVPHPLSFVFCPLSFLRNHLGGSLGQRASCALPLRGDCHQLWKGRKT